MDPAYNDSVLLSYSTCYEVQLFAWYDITWNKSKQYTLHFRQPKTPGRVHKREKQFSFGFPRNEPTYAVPKQHNK